MTKIEFKSIFLSETLVFLHYLISNCKSYLKNDFLYSFFVILYSRQDLYLRYNTDIKQIKKHLL